MSSEAVKLVLGYRQEDVECPALDLYDEEDNKKLDAIVDQFDLCVDGKCIGVTFAGTEAYDTETIDISPKTIAKAQKRLTQVLTKISKLTTCKVKPKVKPRVMAVWFY